MSAGSTTDGARVLALCGGVGGARLARGLALLRGHALTVAVNTGDDFEHFGLHVSPDVDTVLYTLSGRDDAERGWGRAAETWSCMAALAELGAETWFALGDRDLATHLLRSAERARGQPLSAITARLARAFGIAVEILPMSDDPVRTVVCTAQGDLPFQRYFVEKRCEPVATGLRYDGAGTARPLPAFMARLQAHATTAIVICPSNPYLSIDPLLALPGVRAALKEAPAPVVAVSPIIGGRAVKGPTAKLMRELGVEPAALSVAAHYRELVDGVVIDAADAVQRADIEALGMRVHLTDALMRDDADKRRLAAEVLDFATGVASARTSARAQGQET